MDGRGLLAGRDRGGVGRATPTSAPDPASFFDDGDRLWLDKVARNFLPFNVTGNPALVVRPD